MAKQNGEHFTLAARYNGFVYFFFHFENCKSYNSRASCRPILSVIVTCKNKFALPNFVITLSDCIPNWTPFSPITITNRSLNYKNRLP